MPDENYNLSRSRSVLILVAHRRFSFHPANARGSTWIGAARKGRGVRLPGEAAKAVAFQQRAFHIFRRRTFSLFNPGLPG